MRHVNLSGIDEIVKQFEKQVKAYLKQGLSPREAVRKAYKKYPVMEHMRQMVEEELVVQASDGYGDDLGEDARKELLKPWAPDGLTLSHRTTKGNQAVVHNVIQAISKARKEGKSYQDTALSLFDGYKKGGIIPEQDIPKYMATLFRLSGREATNEKLFKSALRKVERSIANIKTHGMRAAYTNLKEAIALRNDIRLEKALYQATQERTRYFARRIARTELARAYHDGMMARYGEDEDVIAYKWKLSSRHPCFDICDFYANADLYGTGKGIYPKDKVPMLPAHPHCMCHLVPVITGSIPNETPKDNVEQGGKAYLDKLTKLRRQNLLGVHGEKKYIKGESWQSLARGYSNKTAQSRLQSIEGKDLTRYNKDKIFKEYDPEKYENSEEFINGISNYEEWSKNLTAEEKEALRDYLGDGYREINKHLRDGNKPTERENHITNAISRFELNENIVVWRGTSNKVWEEVLEREYLEIGDTFILDRGYTSTSIDKNITTSFARGVLFKIKVPKNKGFCAYMECLQVYEEKEMLFKPNVKFKFLGEIDANGVKIIDIEVIGDE